MSSDLYTKQRPFAAGFKLSTLPSAPKKKSADSVAESDCWIFAWPLGLMKCITTCTSIVTQYQILAGTIVILGYGYWPASGDCLCCL